MKSKAVKPQHWQFDFYSQWRFQKMNWYDFTVIELGGEYAAYSDSIEVNFGLLGFNISITYRKSLDFVNELHDFADEITKRLEDEHPGMEIKDPNNLLDKVND